MFGSTTTSNHEDDTPSISDSPNDTSKSTHLAGVGDSLSESDKKSNAGGNQPSRKSAEDTSPSGDKKRRSSGVLRAREMLTSAKQSLHLHSSPPTASTTEKEAQTPIQKLAKSDPALNVPAGSMNNSAGESAPGAYSTFRVGVTEDRNKKCRRTMEDTHAYLYNFLSTPAPVLGMENDYKSEMSESEGIGPSEQPIQQVIETDNGYFAIFDGHAGTFAADWCGKKLHLLLEETIRKNPNTPIPELLDQTFTAVDQQLEKLPLKNSGCTAVIAVLRWEDRVPNSQSATGSAFFAPAAAAAVKAAAESNTHQSSTQENPSQGQSGSDNAGSIAASGGLQPPEARLRESATRQRVLYTANVGDARIVLCRNGRALRLSYDHKGSDENEGRRVANAGGLILNNRVNGVLAVTRALGDAYMKDLVTGHPYTTETVIQPDQDEFLILACDGLWDVCSDQEAVDLVRNVLDPQIASKQLVDHALARFSTDNLSCMIVRFDNKALKQRKTDSNVGVDAEGPTGKSNLSEADALVEKARKQLKDSVESQDKDASNMIIEEDEGEAAPKINAEAVSKARSVK